MLGAKSSFNSNRNADATSTYVKVTQKGDRCGLRERQERDNDKCTGLDTFERILGRLNGKPSEEIAVEQKASDDLHTAMYLERRWQFPHFVSGGFLVGEQLKPVGQKPVETSIPSQKECPHDNQHSDCVRSQKLDDNIEMLVPHKTIDISKQQKMERSRNTSMSIDEPSTKHRRSEEKIGDQNLQGRFEKAKGRLKRKKRRHADQLDETARSQSLPSPIASTINQPSSTPKHSVGDRYAVRQRYIRQKKMALSDAKALNEVCPARRSYEVNCPYLTANLKTFIDSNDQSVIVLWKVRGNRHLSLNHSIHDDVTMALAFHIAAR